MADPDVFISYARDDAATARRFADGLEAAGLTVWWDDALRSGQVFDEAIEQALRAAKAVVVLWSPHSVKSRWVRAEATLADRQNTLVPVTIGSCERPIIFEMVQTADLSGWSGSTADPAWSAFLAHVRAFVDEVPAAARTAAPAPEKREGANPGELSVVVLPFANMGGDPEQEYFADGISEDIITDLSKVSSLLVISRNSAFTFKGKHVDIPEVARQLGVTHVLEGSVRRAGNRVRVTAQLIDGQTNGHVWAERFDRDLEDIFELQDELSQEIVKALRVKLLPREKKAITDRGTTSIEAYDYYMRAKSAANAAMNGEEYSRALELFRKALEIDPDFASALSGVALMLQQQLVFAPELRAKNQQEIDDLLARADTFPKGDSSTHLIRATHHMRKREWRAALGEYRKSMAASLGYDTEIAVVLSTCLLCVGRAADALEVTKTVRAADPLAGFNSILLQMTALMLGRDEESEAEYSRVTDIPVNRDVSEHTAFFRMWQDGDMAASKAQFRRYVDLCTLRWARMEEYLAVIDRPEEAREVLRRALDEPESQSSTGLVLIAIHAGLQGDPDLAIEALRRGTAFDGAMDYIIWWPSLREARQTPGFRQLLRDNGIYAYWRTSGEWGDFARPLGDDDFEMIA